MSCPCPPAICSTRSVCHITISSFFGNSFIASRSYFRFSVFLFMIRFMVQDPVATIDLAPEESSASADEEMSFWKSSVYNLLFSGLHCQDLTSLRSQMRQNFWPSTPRRPIFSDNSTRIQHFTINRKCQLHNPVPGNASSDVPLLYS